MDQPSLFTVDHGEFHVVRDQVHTAVTVVKGDRVELRVSGYDKVNFGGGLLGLFEPRLNADGDPVTAPENYPAPRLRKNSLICDIGGVWHQGGLYAQFEAQRSGEIILAPNDAYPGDNKEGWMVRLITHRIIRKVAFNPKLTVSWIELIQVVQRRDNSIPLVAGKRTAARIFLTSDGDGTGEEAYQQPVRDVNGTVTLSSSAGTKDLPFKGATAFPAGQHNRDDKTHGVLLELPLNLLTGTVKFSVTCSAAGGTGDNWTTNFDTTFTFTPTRRISVRPVLMTQPGTTTPDFAQFKKIAARAIDFLPLAPGAFDFLAPIVLTMPPFRTTDDWGQHLVYLESFARIPLERAVTAAIVHPVTPIRTNGIGFSLPRGMFIVDVSGGLDDSAGTFAHEFCHAVGVLHAPPPNCGADGPFDYRILPKTDQPSLDIATMTLFPSGSNELMGYCGTVPTRRTSTATYLRFIEGVS
jgi:hypothetical protein